MPQSAKIIQLCQNKKIILCLKCKKIQFEVTAPICVVCEGKGHKNSLSDNNCSNCKGYGMVLKPEEKICPACLSEMVQCPNCGHIL